MGTPWGPRGTHGASVGSTKVILNCDKSKYFGTWPPLLPVCALNFLLDLQDLCSLGGCMNAEEVEGGGGLFNFPIQDVP